MARGWWRGWCGLCSGLVLVSSASGVGLGGVFFFENFGGVFLTCGIAALRVLELGKAAPLPEPLVLLTF